MVREKLRRYALLGFYQPTTKFIDSKPYSVKSIRLRYLPEARFPQKEKVLGSDALFWSIEGE